MRWKESSKLCNMYAAYAIYWLNDLVVWCLRALVAEKGYPSERLVIKFIFHE